MINYYIDMRCENANLENLTQTTTFKPGRDGLSPSLLIQIVDEFCRSIRLNQGGTLLQEPTPTTVGILLFDSTVVIMTGIQRGPKRIEPDLGAILLDLLHEGQDIRCDLLKYTFDGNRMDGLKRLDPLGSIRLFQVDDGHLLQKK